MISRTVWILSLVSLFTDIASEMLYPILPLYLQSIGFSILYIGILEGLAEALAGLSKGYFGRLSDLQGKRLPFIQIGYAISALAKPLLVTFNLPLWVLFIRSADRLGKGIRTGARDALLSNATTKENKGKVFGFHRSMDTLGACIGPGISLIYLYFFPENYKSLFLLAFFPGIIAIAFTFFIKEKESKLLNAKNNLSILNFLKNSPLEYKRLIFGLILFSLFNSSDVFLLLRLKETGLQDTQIVLVYIFYNLVYALSSYPMGYIGDKLGLKKSFIFGLALFSLVYFGMGYGGDLYFYLFLFALYGIYAASTEGISKAWITNICPDEAGSAIGSYSGLNSISALFASSIAGILWLSLGGQTLFYFVGVSVFFISIYFTRIKE
jgi:MFS family permease